MKIAIQSPKPRNPLAAAALHRVAGSHRSTERTTRQFQDRAIRRDLLEMKRSP